MTTKSEQHGSLAEIKTNSTIYAHSLSPCRATFLDPKLCSKVWQIKQRRSWIHSVNQALSSEGIPQAKTIDGKYAIQKKKERIRFEGLISSNGIGI